MLFMPSLSKAADSNELSDTESYSESSSEEEMDKTARAEILQLCSWWMQKYNYRHYWTAQFFMAAHVSTPGRDYPTIFAREALKAGADIRFYTRRRAKSLQ